MSAYQRLPNDDSDNVRTAPLPETDEQPIDARLSGATSARSADRPLRESVQQEFNRPAPATWKRVLLVLGILFMGWASIKLGGVALGKKQPQVIYATRYSDEYKYRPAASPVITEYLKDGRIRIRGASVGGVGVREEDVPKSPAQLALEREKRVEEARAAAKAKLKEAKAARADKKKRSSSSRKRTSAKKAKKVKTEI